MGFWRLSERERVRESGRGERKIKSGVEGSGRGKTGRKVR